MRRTRSTRGPLSISLPTGAFVSPKRPLWRACASAWSVAERTSPSNSALPLGLASTSRASSDPSRWRLPLALSS